MSNPSLTSSTVLLAAHSGGASWPLLGKLSALSSQTQLLAPLFELQQGKAPIVSYETTTDGGAIHHQTIVHLDTTDNKSRDFVAQRLCAFLILSKLPQSSLGLACEQLADMYRDAVNAQPSWQPPPTTVRKLARVVKSERPAVVYEE